MRLDKYLKVSRIIKRRTVANEACDAGRVVVNGKIARASYDVKVDDVIARCKGIRCGFKPTSCPDQLANALTQAKEQQKK